MPQGPGSWWSRWLGWSPPQLPCSLTFFFLGKPGLWKRIRWHTAKAWSDQHWKAHLQKFTYKMHCSTPADLWQLEQRHGSMARPGTAYGASWLCPASHTKWRGRVNGGQTPSALHASDFGWEIEKGCMGGAEPAPSLWQWCSQGKEAALLSRNLSDGIWGASCVYLFCEWNICFTCSWQ